MEAKNVWDFCWGAVKIPLYRAGHGILIGMDNELLTALLHETDICDIGGTGLPKYVSECWKLFSLKYQRTVSYVFL